MWKRFSSSQRNASKPCPPSPRRLSMTTTRDQWLRVVGAFLCLTLFSIGPLWAQRADRAIISGVVADAQGAAVPGATVTIRNQATGVDTVLVTNDAGAYTSPPLVLGTYTVKVELASFKTAESGAILLRGGDQIRHDVG